MSEDQKNEEYSALDIEFLLAAAVALWGNDIVSKEEYNFFIEKLKKTKPLSSKVFDVGFADRGDLTLMAKEYTVWLFDTIQSLKNALLEDVDEETARSITVNGLVEMHRSKPENSKEKLIDFIESMKTHQVEFGKSELAIIKKIEETYDNESRSGCGCIMLIAISFIIIYFVREF